MAPLGRRVFVIGFVLLAPTGPVRAVQTLPPLPAYQGRTVAIGPAELAALGRGDPAIVVLDSHDPRMVAVFGIVSIGVSRAFFVTRFADMAQALRAPGRTQFGVFGAPATSADASSLVVSAADAKSLQLCRPGSCEFKLPAAEMSHVRTILENAGAAGPVELSKYARKRVADYVNAYRERGSAAMVVYDDYGPVGVRASEAFNALITTSSWVSQYAPALQGYLTGYPHGRPDGLRESIYWVREEMAGMRATLSISHLMIYTPPDRPQMTVVVTKQIFADHYFEGALDVLVAAGRSDVPRGEGMYLMLLRQYRFDHLPSGGLLAIRARVRGRLRERAEAELRALRTENQAAWARRRP
jgi:hypothetical protein